MSAGTLRASGTGHANNAMDLNNNISHESYVKYDNVVLSIAYNDKAPEGASALFDKNNTEL